MALAYDYLAQYDSAMIFYQKTFDKRSEMNDPDGMAGAIFNAGASYHYRSLYSLALDYYLKALAIYKITRNEIGITRCFTNIGTIYRARKDYRQALANYMEVKKIRERNMDEEGLMFVYNNISSILFYIGNYRESILYGLKSSTLAGKLEKNVDLANALMNVGVAYLSLHQYDSARFYLFRSREAIGKTNDKQYRAFILTAIGEYYLENDNYTKSIAYLDSALYLAETAQRAELMSKCYKLLSKAFELSGNQSASLDYYKKSTSLNDSLLNQENLRQMNEMNAIYKLRETEIENYKLFTQQYDANKKAAKSTSQRNLFILLSIALLIVMLMLIWSIRNNRQKTKELEVKSTIIEKSLIEKELLLKEVHHRVKNNLQLVTSLLQLQLNRTNDPAITEALTESQNRINSMSLIHQYLYSTENIGNVDMKVYTEKLITAIENSFNKPGMQVDKIMDIENVHFNIDIAIPIGIIMTELITNSFKYAFLPQQQNKLVVKLKMDAADTYMLTVQDNGTGAIKDSGGSLGLKLVELMCKQLRANIVFNDNDGLEAIIKGKIIL